MFRMIVRRHVQVDVEMQAATARTTPNFNVGKGLDRLAYSGHIFVADANALGVRRDRVNIEADPTRPLGDPIPAGQSNPLTVDIEREADRVVFPTRVGVRLVRHTNVEPFVHAIGVGAAFASNGFAVIRRDVDLTFKLRPMVGNPANEISIELGLAGLQECQNRFSHFHFHRHQFRRCVLRLRWPTDYFARLPACLPSRGTFRRYCSTAR